MILCELPRRMRDRYMGSPDLHRMSFLAGHTGAGHRDFYQAEGVELSCLTEKKEVGTRKVAILALHTMYVQMWRES